MQPIAAQPTAATPIALTMVIPAYNEARRLPATLRDLRAYLRQTGRDATTEVIVVDDGSADGTTDLVVTARAAWPLLSVITLPHAGKGHAIRAGALAARGALVFFCDADLSMPLVELPKFLTLGPADRALIIGSHEAPGARRFGEPVTRHLMGRVFNWLTQWLVLPGLNDTQCGFKCLPRAVARDLCGQLRLTGFGFDVELLALARARGYAIHEVPIDWYYGAESRVRPLVDTARMVREVWLARRHARALARSAWTGVGEPARRGATVTAREE